MITKSRSFRRLARGSVAAALALYLVLASTPATRADVPANAEFGGSCAMGLAEGKRIKTDCKVNWTAPDGKLYCFGNEDSKAHFLQDPDKYIQQARETFAAADSQQTADDMGRFTPDEAKTLVEAHIAEQSKDTGAFKIEDPVLGQTLNLKFVSVEFVRTLHGYGFFPNVNFAAPDDVAKKYQIDFWVRPQGGKLAIIDTRIYKAPRREGDGWVMITRQPKPWWWIPASEHPGESETKRGWEVMSALHGYVASEKAKHGGPFVLKDDKTGEELKLDFVGIHQPVRRLKENGKFFACTDFRKEGSKDEFYDIDFWLDQKTGALTVGEVRIHKVPQLEDGNFVQIPRYQFDPKTFDVVP